MAFSLMGGGCDILGEEHTYPAHGQHETYGGWAAQQSGLAVLEPAQAMIAAGVGSPLGRAGARGGTDMRDSSGG